MEANLLQILDVTFEETKKRMLSEHAGRSCDGIAHLLHKCECENDTAQREPVVSNYMRLISVSFSW